MPDRRLRKLIEQRICFAQNHPIFNKRVIVKCQGKELVLSNGRGSCSTDWYRELEGSCQCGEVQFTLLSNTPVPYQLCACSICRKISGFSGSINIGGIADSLKVLKGKELIKWVGFIVLVFCTNSKGRRYHAIKDRGKPEEEKCSSFRSFCSNCSTMLWVWDDRWGELIHPFAPAIDTELPEPQSMVCIMDGSKPKWARWPEGPKEIYDTYGPDSLEDWHKKNGVYYD